MTVAETVPHIQIEEFRELMRRVAKLMIDQGDALNAGRMLHEGERACNLLKSAVKLLDGSNPPVPTKIGFAEDRMDTAEAAEYIGVAKNTTDNWRSQNSGGPPYYKPGKAVYYTKVDLDTWLAAGKRTNTATK